MSCRRGKLDLILGLLFVASLSTNIINGSNSCMNTRDNVEVIDDSVVS